MRRRYPVALAVFVMSVMLGAGPQRVAHASIADRVVAVVGDRPILLSELRVRARPHLSRVASQTGDDAQRTAAESTVLRELLGRLIDERLEQQAADKAGLSVTVQEVDSGIRQVAQRARLSPSEVVEEARRQGLSEQEYRDEVGRQVLEGKLIALRVRGRVRVTDDDVRAAYARWVADLDPQARVDLRMIILQIRANASQATVQAIEALAHQIVERARSGTDFCTLVTRYSQSSTNTAKCGSYGAVATAALTPELAQVSQQLRPGDISEPVLFRDALGHQSFLVVQKAPNQLPAPSFDDVREQMTERAIADVTERQRKQWLQELRRTTFIDVRL